MAEFKVEAITVLLLLLPGFLASRLKQRLTVIREQSELDKIVEALLYSFVIYVIYSFFVRSFPVTLTTETKGQATGYSLKNDPRQLLILIAIAIGLGVLMSFAANHDIWGRFFRRIKVSNRSWRDTIWSDVFHNFGGAVQVELSDSRIVMGWLKYFSDRPGDSSLFLERAAWVTADYKLVPITGPGIFLTKDSGIRSISFLKWQDGDFKNLRKKGRIVPLMWFLAALMGAILGIFYLRLHHLWFGITFFATAVVSIFIGWRSRPHGWIAAPSTGEIIQAGPQ